MSGNSVFETVIQPDLERIPLLESLHVEHFNGHDFTISQVVVKNIFTDFDRQLSRHLAATRGEGFPRFTIFVRFREDGETGKWRSFEPSHHASVPHALRAVAERAVSFGRSNGIVLRHAGRTDSKDEGAEVALDREDIDSLSDALAVCDSIGEAEFMEISGDFDIVLCRPSSDQKPVTMYLRKGSVNVPTERSSGGLPFECPIAGFKRGIRDDVGAQSYIAVARHALAAAKEKAVSDFRAAAEVQIMGFDRALNGRPLEGHRFDSANTLITRLKAGLGEELRGLCEAARITAMEWSLAINTVEELGGPRISVATEGGRQATV